MGTITLPNWRATSDGTIRVRLKDGGLAIDWPTLTDIKAWLYSDAQKAIAGRFSVSVDPEDATLLRCDYSAQKPQYLGVNRIIVQARYMGRTKTYDKPAINIVARTAELSGQEVVMEDPVVDVEIEVEDVTSSILDEAVQAALSAAERADAAAEAAKEMVDLHTGPAGKSAYQVAVDNGYTGTEEEWLASLVGPAGKSAYQLAVDNGYVGTLPEWIASLKGEPGDSAYEIAVQEGFVGTKSQWLASLVGPQGLSAYQVAVAEGYEGSISQWLASLRGPVGPTPNITIGTVTTGAPGTPVVATITGTAENPVLNLTIPQGIQGNPGSSVDYPFELVNNETTDDPNKAHTAAGAKRLKDELSQLEAKLPMLGGYLVPLLRKIVYKDDNAESLINGINALLNTVELTSITAVYTQPGTIYEGQSLDDLKSGLVVTANYNDGTSVEVDDYELSGTLTAGMSSIVVTYQEETTTFNVTVTDAVYYKDGSLFPGQVGVRNNIETTSGLASSYVLNGVSYVFSSAYANGGNATTQKRCSYFLFDLLLTAGKTYKYIIEFNSAPSSSQAIQSSLGYYDETYRVAGVTNAYQTQNYSSNVQATSWWATTKDGNTISFSDTAPSGYVGVRISLKCVVSGSDAVWPTALSVKRLIIQEVE